MNTTENIKQLVGYFIKRHDLTNINVINLTKELQHHAFEAKIMQQTIQAIQNNNFTALDCSVGDWKCQTRTSMLINLLYNNPNLLSRLSQELVLINSIINKIENLITTIQQLNPSQSQELRQLLKRMSLAQYLAIEQIEYNASKELTLFNLCFLTTVQNNLLHLFNEHQISTNKMKAIINESKSTLCYLSINYEQEVAKKYNSSDEQKALSQIEFKGMQHMTALFSGFKALYKKMHAQQESFLANQILFCRCGGIQSINPTLFISKNNEFIPANFPEDLNQAMTIIEAYQYQGSLEQLQTILGIPHHESGIPTNYYRQCLCKNPTPPAHIESMNQALLAFFAQHPQFTNHKEIDFQGLGLMDSDLKKEYDFLLTLPGFSRQNMSIFHINHMYPATIAHVISENKQLLQAMKTETNNTVYQRVPIAQTINIKA